MSAMSDADHMVELPILDEVGDALYEAAVRADEVSAARRPLRALGSRLHRPLVVALVVTAASGTMGGLALAGTFSGTTISPQAWVDGQRVTPAAASSPSQNATLGILQRPRVAADALPPYYARALPNSPTGGGDGVNIALSHRAYGFNDGAAAWVIPGNNGTVCMVAANAQAIEQSNETGTPTHIPGADDSVNCESLAVVDSGWPLSYGFGLGDTPGVYLSAGIVPNGVNQVTIGTSTGQSVALPVHDNVWLGYVTGVQQTLTFTGPNGTVTNGGPAPAPPPQVKRVATACKRLQAEHRGGIC